MNNITISTTLLKACSKMCNRNKQCKGFFFYDGYGKACTLYSEVDDQYFPYDSNNEGFCSHLKDENREERFQQARYRFWLKIISKLLKDLLFLCWETMWLIDHLQKKIILFFEYKNKVYYQLVLPLSAVHSVVNTENSDNEERICFIHGFLLLHWVLLRTWLHWYLQNYIWPSADRWLIADSLWNLRCGMVLVT